VKSGSNSLVERATATVVVAAALKSDGSRAVAAELPRAIALFARDCSLLFELLGCCRLDAEAEAARLPVPVPVAWLRLEVDWGES